MKYKSYLIILLFLIFGAIRLFAQTIEADIKTGCDSMLVTFSLSPPVLIGTTVLWNFGNGMTSSGNLSPNQVYKIPGKYTVTCLINNTKIVIATDLIKLYRTPSSKFRYNDSLAIGSYSFVFRHLRLPVDTGTLSYNWLFVDNLSSILGTGITPNIVFPFPHAGVFKARLITSYNVCADTTERKIEVSNLLEVPNVFTPNDDTKNDFFQVRTDGINTYTFSVYTRSGVLIYQSESPSIIWDGRSFSGQVLRGGVYYYTIEQKAVSPVTTLKGFVYLLR